MRRQLWAAALLSLAALGAVNAVGADERPTPLREQQDQAVADAQAELSARALRSLDGRTCPPVPDRGRLEGLSGDALACLGEGPALEPATSDGRPTVVNLWASWCAPCVREMPLLQSVAERAGADVRFLGVATQDAQDSAAGLLEATGVRYPQYDDPDGELRNRLRAAGLPVTLVFDGSGREVARRFGEVDQAWLDQALLDAGAAPTPSGP